MKRLVTAVTTLLGIAAAVWMLAPSTTLATLGPSASFVAYSLRQAGNLARTGSQDPNYLGGITEPVAFVYDANNDDYVLVGVADGRKPAMALDSFVAALRATTHQELPEVSIDPPAAGGDPRQQPVVFHGRLENTRLGMEMLDADIALKHLALGKVRGDVWAVQSYLALSAEDAHKNGSLPSISSRFWLRAGDTKVSGGGQDDAMVVQSCKVHVDTEVITSDQGKQDAIGETFAAQVAASFPDLAIQYPALARVVPILRMVALADEISRTRKGSGLDYWLNQYQMAKTQTPRTYDLEEARQEVPESTRVVVLTGGIDTNPVTIRLNGGDATALREVVLQSRPRGNPLVWRPPLDNWDYAGEDSFIGGSPGGSSPNGFSIFRTLDSLRPGSPGVGARPPQLPPAPPPPPSFANPPAAFNNPAKIDPLPPSQLKLSQWQPTQYAPRVGGVMLRATAHVSGTGSPIDVTSSNFALVVDGENARPSPMTFRRFVTALWAVYFSDQDPGISIDPIGPQSEKHLVRYIGNVVNTDLGRVMREADYLMKKWAVGTERANIPGFKNPDDFIAKVGIQANAWSRFWFVPEDMTFKQAGDMLLFSGGRMTVKTEYLSKGIAAQAEPANQRFADLFTNQYDRIAASYPVYQELFEYAKLVSLAKYLKQSGVPLTWFLMANKDLILTEDSPGTVDALAHGSDYYKNLTLTGGVDLKTAGRYVYDPTAVNAIQQAMARSGPEPSAHSTIAAAPMVSPSASEPFSFDLGKSSYSVVPQYSLATGKDQWGNRYQTDITLKNGSEPGLELVRYFDPRQTAQSEFGKGWRLLVPYRVKPLGDETREFLNVRVPVKMSIDNLLTGRNEVLTFSTDRYSIAGYVPDKLATSQLVGLFITTSASFRLADKLGNEFWFDQGGDLTDIAFVNQDRIHYQYLSRATDAFEHAPFEIKPADSETVEYRGQTLPKRIVVRDPGNSREDTLSFDLTQSVATYFPSNSATVRYQQLRWTPDGGYVLQDKQGNLVGFKTDGKFEAMLPVLKDKMIQSVSMGAQKIAMSYEMNPEGRIVVGKAALSTGDDLKPQLAVRYEYNNDGTLARTERVEASKKLALNRSGHR
jgi:hypothetical protein